MNPSVLILMIASIDPDNAIFARDYVRPKVVRGGKPVGRQVSSFNGFFEGLPPAKKAKKTNQLSFKTQKDRDYERMEATEDKIAELQRKLQD